MADMLTSEQGLQFGEVFKRQKAWRRDELDRAYGIDDADFVHKLLKNGNVGKVVERVSGKYVAVRGDGERRVSLRCLLEKPGPPSVGGGRRSGLGVSDGFGVGGWLLVRGHEAGPLRDDFLVGGGERLNGDVIGREFDISGSFLL